MSIEKTALICDCGGKLKKNGRFWECEYCKTRWLLDIDALDETFIHRVIEKETIEHAQMAQISQEIKVKRIVVREIQPRVADDNGAQDGLFDISASETLRMIKERMLRAGNWEAADSEIGVLLSKDPDDPETRWLKMMCDRRARSEQELFSSFSRFDENDAKTLSDLLSFSSAERARSLIDQALKSAYNDRPYMVLLSTILPYAKNDLIYGEDAFKDKIADAFDVTMRKQYPTSFEYLLLFGLESHEVDRYLSLIERFADASTDLSVSEKYYRKYLETDPGSVGVRRKLLRVLLKENAPKEKVVGDFRELIKYADDPDDETQRVINDLIDIVPTTDNNAKCMWALLGYHSLAPAALLTELIAYIQRLLDASLWDQAKEFSYLVISIDKTEPVAYRALCLARLKKTSEAELPNCEETLTDVAEFKKAYTVFDKVDKNRAGRWWALVDQQISARECQQRQEEDTKKEIMHKVKIAIAIALPILILITLIAIITAVSNYKESQKCDPDNIIITADKIEGSGLSSSYSEAETARLYLKIENRGISQITRIVGNLVITDFEGKVLNDSTMTWKGRILPDDEIRVTLDIDRRDADDLRALRTSELDELRMTFRLTEIYYEYYPDDSIQGQSGSRTFDDTEACLINTPASEEEIKNRQSHADALDLFGAGKYSDAYESFKRLGNYRDSAERAADAKEKADELERQYDAAKALYDNGKYEDAQNAFENLNGYGDSVNYVELCAEELRKSRYESAVKLFNEEKYEDALVAFKELGNYKDSANYEQNCKNEINKSNYETAVKLYNEGQFDQAYAAFEKLGYYEDSAVMLKACKYGSAMSVFNAGKYEEAIRLFENLSGYKDSDEMVLRSKYEIAQKLYASGRYEEAHNAFDELGNYKDSSEKSMSAYRMIYSSASIGSTVKLGKISSVVYNRFFGYDRAREEYEIEWQVLAKENGKMLVISKYVLFDGRGFASSFWKDTRNEARNFLNGTFLDSCFTKSEKELIAEVAIKTAYEGDSSDWFSGETVDHIFLLSKEEVSKYLPSAKNRMAKFVPSGTGSTTQFQWSLRTGKYDAGWYLDSVEKNGEIRTFGLTQYIGIRPAMWIDISS